MALALLLTACAASSPPPQPDQIDHGATSVIYVTSNGWHSGIILLKEDIPPELIPEAADFPNARFLEFGWGDADFYQAKEPTAGISLRAALVPTPAVVHVAGFLGDPARVFANTDAVALPISDDKLHRLTGFIDDSFARSGAPRAEATGPGLYASSRFYPATGSFHAFNTCNTWTARALEVAGFDIQASGTIRAGPLMQQVRAFAQRR